MRGVRFFDRFASDVLSWPLWLRVVVTVPVVWVAYVLGKSLYFAAADGTPAAAILFLLLGMYLLYAVPWLRVVWRTSEVWRRVQARDAATARELETMLRRRVGGTTTSDALETGIAPRAAGRAGERGDVQ